MPATVTLRVLTTSPPPHRGAKHGYVCTCPDCHAERAQRTAGTCRCPRPVLYTDAEGDTRCTCGRAARQPAQQRAA